MDFLQHPLFWMLRSFKSNQIRYFVAPRRTIHQYEIDPASKLKKITNLILSRSILKKILKSSALSSIKNTVLFQLNLFIYKNFNFYQKPEFVIGTGLYGRSQWTERCSIDNFISIRSRDVCWDSSLNLINKRYCIYVDESIIYSPDRGLWDQTSKNSASSNFEVFLNNICNVFDMIEKKLGVTVIIAASGKYKYENVNLYNNRKIVYDKTNQLIQHSELVLGHSSTGVYQAVIDRKPLITLIDPTFTEYKKRHTRLLSEFLMVEVFETTKFSINDLDNTSVNHLHFKKLEEQYFRESGSLNNYQEIFSQDVK